LLRHRHPGGGHDRLHLDVFPEARRRIGQFTTLIAPGRKPPLHAISLEIYMKLNHLPRIDARYWVAILAASMCGANTGDFASRILGLGHTRGLLPLAVIFLAVLWAERRSRVATEAYYWLAIIVLRTGATNLADLGTHDLKLGYLLCMAALAAFMVLMLLIDRVRGVAPTGVVGPDGRWHSLPATDASYWITMLAAGTLGTAAGDWVAEATGLGLAYGSLVLVAVLLATWLVSDRLG